MANVQDCGPPSTAAIAVSTAIISGLAGYYLGQARSIGLFAGSPSGREQQQDETADDADSASDSADSEELGDFKDFPNTSEECKLVLVTRTDLGMTKGKFGTSEQSFS